MVFGLLELNEILREIEVINKRMGKERIDLLHPLARLCIGGREASKSVELDNQAIEEQPKTKALT